MQLGIFARTFTRASVDEVFAAVRKQGFSTVQFNMVCAGLPSMPDEIPDAIVAEIQAARERHQIEVCGLSATFNLIHPDRAVSQSGLRRMEVLAQQARAIGTDLLTICTGTRDPEDQWRHHPDNNTPAAWAEMRANLEKALQLAERYDLSLGIETEVGNVINSAAKAQRIITELGSDRLCILLDPANLFERESPAEIERRIDEAVDLLGPYLRQAHAKDRDAAGNYVAPGEGLVPFAYFVRRLQEAGFGGPLVAHGFPEAAVPAVHTFLQRYV